MLCLWELHSARPQLFQLQGFCIGRALSQVTFRCGLQNALALLSLYISAQKGLPTAQLPTLNTTFHFVFLAPIRGYPAS